MLFDQLAATRKIQLKTDKKEVQSYDRTIQRIKKKLKDIQGDKIISGYTTIKSEYLGFPLSEPENKMIYRVDNTLRYLDNVIDGYKNGDEQLELTCGWGNIDLISQRDVDKIRNIRKRYYEKASAFFRTGDIEQWTAELDSLKKEDSNFQPDDDIGQTNLFAQEAFLAIKYFSGYVMTRAVVEKGRLPELEERIDKQYMSRIIDI